MVTMWHSSTVDQVSMTDGTSLDNGHINVLLYSQLSVVKTEVKTTYGPRAVSWHDAMSLQIHMIYLIACLMALERHVAITHLFP